MQSQAQGISAKERRAERSLRERGLARLAARQHGVVARRQLIAAGLGPSAIDMRVNSGRLHVVHRGVYAVGHNRLDRRGRWLAAVLACGDGSVLSHRSAATLWGLAGNRRGPIDVTSDSGRGTRKGIRLHRSRLRDDERTIEAGIPVTSVARTLIDLAEVLDRDRLRHAFEEADRLKQLHLPELGSLCLHHRGRRGMPALRSLISAAQAPAPGRSPLENRFAEFFREHLSDMPEPQTNVLVLDHEVDAYWPSHRLVVELDGWQFHGHRAAFERDRRLDAAMLAAGYHVIHLTDLQLKTEAQRIAKQLRGLLAAKPDPGSEQVA